MSNIEDQAYRLDQSRIAKLQAENRVAREVIRNLLRASDAAWFHGKHGHDWKHAVIAAEGFLRVKGLWKEGEK